LAWPIRCGQVETNTTTLPISSTAAQRAIAARAHQVASAAACHQWPTAPQPPPRLDAEYSRASPFATKSRSITDFYIQPDHPHKQYSPGDLVTGSVRLRVLRPTRVTHVVVSLHGYAQVFKNPGSPGEGFRATPNYLGTGRGKKSAEYFGNGFASLFEDELVLCGDGRLAEGAYQFNFELEFPNTDLPSSIDVSIPLCDIASRSQD
jgi:hypothetical protein